MEPHRKGDLTEAAVLTELKRQNVPAAFPFGDNEQYDIITEAPSGALYRLQIKTGRLSDGAVKFDAVRSHTNSTGQVYKPYGDQVDFFAVYCHELERLYLLRRKTVGTSKTLRVESGGTPDPRTTPAEQYRFDHVWPPDDEEPEHSDPVETNLRKIVEQFEDAGARVFTPARQRSDADFVARTPAGNLFDVTVRTASVSDGRVQVSLGDGHSADYCAVQCDSNGYTYLVRTDESPDKISLRVTEPEQVQPNTRWASEYRLDNVWPPENVPENGPESAVGAAIRAFERAGINVGPVTDESGPFDLFVRGEDSCLTVSVVSCHVSRGCLRLKPGSKDGIDAFVIYHRESDDCYFVRGSEFNRSISLRMQEPNKPDPSITWAREYEIDEDFSL
jgi:hypothetical protein